MYRDKIIRNREFKIDKNKLSASGNINSEILEILRKWPSNSEIYDTVQIAHQNAFNFAKMIDLISNELELAPIVFVDNNNLVDEDEDKELMSIDDDEKK
ncbi:unnamed protein product [Rhizophagus irregularis]|nr:unnamed protein product [Rhizophagus irregularis]